MKYYYYFLISVLLITLPQWSWAQLDTPVLSCGEESSTDQVCFTWPVVEGALIYAITISINESAPLETTVVLNEWCQYGLSQGDVVTLTVIAQGPPGDSEMATLECVANDCPALELTLGGLAPTYCTGDEAATILPSLVGDCDCTGLGVSGLSFSPEEAGAGAVTITCSCVTEEDACIYTAGATVMVYDNTNPGFNLSTTTACVGEIITADLAGVVDPSAVYAWNFTDVGAANVLGNEVYELIWDAPGTYEVVLAVQAGDCSSEAIAQTLVIEAADDIGAVTVNAIPDIAGLSVTFDWDMAEGADAYQVSYVINDSGVSLELVTENEFLLSDLDYGDVVELCVFPISADPCYAYAENCIQQTLDDCPPLELSIDAPTQICSGGSAVPIAGFPEGGTLSGPGVSDSSFDPADLSPGEYTLSYEFFDEETTCTYTTSIVVEISEGPSAVFEAPFFACLGELTLLEYAGTSSPTMDFVWEVNGVGTLEGEGPHYVTFNTAGDYDITLSVQEEGGCVGSYTETIDIHAVELDVANAYSISVGESIDLDFTATSTAGGIFYSWEPGNGLSCDNCPTPTASPLETSTYLFTAINDFGCYEQIEVTIYVDALGLEENTSDMADLLVVPHVVDASRTSSWNINWMGAIPVDVNCEVYDMQGRMLFRTSDMSQGWQVGQVPSGVYVYRIELIDASGQKHQYSQRFLIHR